MSSPVQRPASPRRKRVLIALTLLLGLGLLEGMSAFAITLTAGRFDEPIARKRAIYARQSDHIRRTFFSDSARGIRLDPHLGWTYAPLWRDSITVHNSHGLRGEREYDTRPRPGTVRVAAFGDSFVYGNEASSADAWPAIMERMDPALDVLNYGVGGYGVDQAFLRYLRDGRQFNPNVVLICFTTDDLRRLVNVYRRFLSVGEIPLFKPRFVADAGAPRLVPTPVQSLADYQLLLDEPSRVRAHGALDQWYEPLVYDNPLYDWSATVRLTTSVWIKVARRYLREERLFSNGEFRPDSEAFRLQVALFRAFRDSVVARGAQPLVVFLPDRGSVASTLAGGRTHYAPLADTLAAHNIAYVDAVQAFAEPAAGFKDAWFMPYGHYSPSGNALVAKWLLSRVGVVSPR